MRYKIAIFVFAISISLGLRSDASAQWVRTNGPYANSVTALAVRGTQLFAGTNGSGVFLTTDEGATWSPENEGLSQLRIMELFTSGPNLFALSFNGVSRSTNNGANWTPFTTAPGVRGEIHALAISGLTLFAGADSGLYISRDNGLNWNPLAFSDTTIYHLIAAGPHLLAESKFGMYHSTNRGEAWTKYIDFLDNATESITTMTTIGSIVIATGGKNIYRSVDAGANWKWQFGDLSVGNIHAFDPVRSHFRWDSHV
jgi:hypothetical protein